ncbi:MAG: glycosyl transferase [Methylobacter sp.]|nr:MAG: glycosyl transferase [Methylobacter sp.]
MKIIHIIISLERGGAQTMLKHLILADPVTLPDTAVVSLTSPGVIGEALCRQGVLVHSLNLSPSGLNSPWVLWRLIKLIRRFKPDIVQTWMYHADLLGGLAARLAGHKRIVWNIRIASVPTSNRLTIVIMKLCAVLSFWIPQTIICAAEAAKQRHIRYGYDGARMEVIANGFDFSGIDESIAQTMALRRTCGFSETDSVIGWVGRFHPDKGQDNFVKAAAIVIKQYPTVKFLLVGPDCTAHNAKLMNWLRAENLQDRFVLLGERGDVPACLAAMDIFCMPSANEGFPNALGEAMAIGKPCVATDVGDAAVLAGEAAILVPPQNAHALAQGLLTMLALPKELRQQMGQAAKARVVSEFSIAKARMRFDAVYQSLCEGSRR